MRKNFIRTLASLLVVVMLVCAVPVVGFSASATNIPSDAVEFNGHHYKVYDVGMTWKDSEKYCESLGGHLATVTSNDEQLFIEKLLLNAPKNVYWLGASDEEREGVWKWITGEEFSYSKWAYKQPDNNLNGTEDFLMIYKKTNPNVPRNTFGYWNDLNNSGTYNNENLFGISNFGLVCEWESNEYYIHGRKFDRNVDYYAAYLLNSSSYNATFANMLAALSADVYNETDIKKAYQSLGFTDFGVYEYDGAFNPNRCGYAMGFKKSEYNDDTICLISVRGSNNVSDWVGNIEFSVNDYKHTGFSYPANSIYNNIQSTLKNKNISGNVKYVLNGHSRGAAVANLLAVKLMENGVDSTNVFDYNFACPDVACRFKFPHYGNIFNLCNREDVVPHVPGSVISSFAIPGMSWGKFGQTYWFTKDDPNTLSPFADHSIELYLEFFDQQLAPSDWSSSFMDKAGDLVKKGIGWSTKIFCPVDVIITDLYGNKIASVINGKVNYYDSNFGDVIIFTDGDKKAIYVEGENYFNINLIGTDIGEMTYTVEKYELLTEKVLESKTFSNVKIEKGKKMYSPVSEAITTDDIELFVIKNENGKDIVTHTINVDGTEIEKEPNPSASCKCMCHKTGFMGFIYKIARFFWKLFKTHKTCDCGVAHY